MAEILVCDDDKDIVEAIEIYLAQEGHHILKAYDGEQAIRVLQNNPVDLLIIMLGTNDTKERFGASAACIALGLKRLAEKAQSVKDCWRGGKPNILLVTPQNIGKEYEQTHVASTMGAGCAEKSRGLASEYKALAEVLGCEYLDANEAVLSGPNQIDYMHLTAEGHEQLADALERKVRSIFKDCISQD